MDVIKLSKCFSWEILSCKRITNSEIIDILENEFWIVSIQFNYIKDSSWSNLTVFYYNLFSEILKLDNWQEILLALINKYSISDEILNWTWYKKYLKTSTIEDVKNKIDIEEDKKQFLIKFEKEVTRLRSLNTNVKYNKWKWNDFEKLCEEFLCKSSYFKKGFIEFAFQDKTEKIDRLLKLKKSILNIENELNLWYVIMESKFKLSNKNDASEVSQLWDYIDRLYNYWISSHAIVITSTSFKDTYIKKLLNKSVKLTSNEKKPYFVSLLTTEEIIRFLQNKDGRNLTYDEFIEESFIASLI